VIQGTVRPARDRVRDRGLCPTCHARLGGARAAKGREAVPASRCHRRDDGGDCERGLDPAVPRCLGAGPLLRATQGAAATSRHPAELASSPGALRRRLLSGLNTGGETFPLGASGDKSEARWQSNRWLRPQVASLRSGRRARSEAIEWWRECQRAIRRSAAAHAGVPVSLKRLPGSVGPRMIPHGMQTSRVLVPSDSH